MTIKKNTSPMTYNQSGVNIQAGNDLVERIKPLAQSTYQPGVMGAIGGFGALFDLKAHHYQDPILVSCTDGVGTKLKIACQNNFHKTIGIDLVAMNVNDLIVQGAKPLFFLDYFSAGQLDVQQAQDVISGIAQACRETGTSLIGGETAEMPGFYKKGDYNLAGFAVGAVERNKILDGQKLQHGDIIIGLDSSGPHANGYSFIHALMKRHHLKWNDACPFDSKYTLGEKFLEPTCLYVNSALAAYEQNFVHAMAHITGGGLIENIPRVLPAHLSAHIDAQKWTVPDVFKWIQEAGKVESKEMATTFNCGIGMILMTSPEHVNQTLDLMSQWGQKAQVIGHIFNNTSHQPDVNIHGMEEQWKN